MNYPAPSNSTEPLSVNPKIAAELIGSTSSSLNKDRSSGHLGIPYVKVGKRVMYCPSDLKDWLNSHKVFPAKAQEDISSIANASRKVAQ